jgi:hypothetical protein
MNTRIFKIIISLGLFVMLSGFAVNAQDLKLTATIPFDFIVGDIGMPAGDYDVTRISAGSRVFQVRDQDCNNVAARLVMPVQRLKVPTETVLIFNLYRENGGEMSYFLSQIWFQGNDTGYQVFKHRAEREAALRAARRDIITIVVPRSNQGAK